LIQDLIQRKKSQKSKIFKFDRFVYIMANKSLHNLANHFARFPNNKFKNVSPFLSIFQGASQAAANLLLMV